MRHKIYYIIPVIAALVSTLGISILLEFGDFEVAGMTAAIVFVLGMLFYKYWKMDITAKDTKEHRN